MAMIHWTLLVGAMVLVGCGPRKDQAERSADTGGMMGHMDSGGMAGRNMQSMQMMPGMKAHMDSMARMTPEQMQGAMSRHEAMMSQMMDRMGADMRQMNMSSSPQWTALTDSVKQDLAELPNLKGQQLSTRMRAHAARVQRLISSHEQMMKGMQ